MSICTPERITALEARFVEIDTARAALAMGQKVAKLSADGESVEYAPSDLAALNDLETRTKMELAKCKGTPTGWGRMRRAY